MPNRGKNRKNDQYAMLDRRRQVAALYLQGRGQCEIARRLGVCQATVCHDLAAVREEWLASALRDFDARKAEELAKLDRLEREAWAAWRRSRRDAQTRQVETATALRGPKAKGRAAAKGPARLVPVRRVTGETARGQAGDPRFLAQVGWCVETRLKVMGVLREVKNVNQVAAGVVDWRELAKMAGVAGFVNETVPAVDGEAAARDGDGVDRVIPAAGWPANEPSPNGDGHR
jgi:hypothetical protein